MSPKGKTAKTKTDANLGLDAKLWQMVDGLRNNMDAAEYKHVVLTPGRYVGAEAQEEDTEPFEEKMKRLTATLREQQTTAKKLDAAIAANLPVRRSCSEGGKELGYGG